MIGLGFVVLLMGMLITAFEDGFNMMGIIVVFWVCIGFWVVFTKYYVVIPVAVIERKSVFASFSRSSELTMDEKSCVFFLICSLFVFIVFMLT